MALKDFIKGGETVMDYGTGSGVLAVGALKMGAARAAGTDVDRFSITASKKNAALNRVSDRLSLFLCGADMTEPEPLAQVQLPATASSSIRVLPASGCRLPSALGCDRACRRATIS